MFISKMREATVAVELNKGQSQRAIKSLRFEWLSKGKEKIPNVGLFFSTLFSNVWKKIHLTYMQILLEINQRKSIIDSEKPPMVGIVDEPMLEERKQYFGPKLFERLVMKGEAEEGPLVREEFGTGTEMGEKNSLIILATRTYIKTRQFFRGLMVVVRESAGERGRKWMNIKKDLGSKMASLRQASWHGLGLVETGELESLRAELGELKRGMGVTRMPPFSMITTHDRRSEERRSEYLTVAYERRTLQRRA